MEAGTTIVVAERPGGRAADFRMLGLSMVGGGVALQFLPAVGPLCPLRRTTGVPCPFCGMTTGVLALARGDVAAAFAANPLAPFLVLVVLIAFVTPLWRTLSNLRLPEPLYERRHVIPWVLLAPLWLFQLHRFDIL